MSFLKWDISCRILNAFFRINNKLRAIVFRLSVGEILNLCILLTICVTNRTTYRQNGVAFYLYLVILIYMLFFHSISIVLIMTRAVDSKWFVIVYKTADLIYDIFLLLYNHFVCGLVCSNTATVVTFILIIDIFFNCLCFGIINFDRKCDKDR